MRKRQVVLYIVVMLLLLTTSVYATISAELNFKIVTNNGNKFYAGDEFTMTIGLKNIEASQGIKSIEGYIDIDENIFENLTLNSIVTDANGNVNIGTNNELLVYDANTISSNIDKGVIFNNNPVSEKGDYKIVINLENPISSATDLVTFKFKIKDNVAAGNYQSVMTYKLFNVFSTDAGEKLELDSQSYRIEISDRNQEDNNNVVNNAIDNSVVNNVVSDENEVTNTPENKPVNNAVANENKATNNSVNKSVNNAVNNENKAKNNQSDNVKNAQDSNSQNMNQNGKVSSGNKADNTLSPTKLPKTGYRLILIPIIAIAIVGLVFYKKYSKYNNYHE